jgi:hypothetical protein
MKIKISRSQWKQIGQKTGWINKASENNSAIRYFKRIQDGWEDEKSLLYKLEGGILSVRHGDKWCVINNCGISDIRLKTMGLYEVNPEEAGVLLKLGT